MALTNLTRLIFSDSWLKNVKKNCKSLFKCGELNHREEKINVKLMTGAYNVTLTTRRKRMRRRRG